MFSYITTVNACLLINLLSDVLKVKHIYGGESLWRVEIKAAMGAQKNTVMIDNLVAHIKDVYRLHKQKKLIAIEDEAGRFLIRMC